MGTSWSFLGWAERCTITARGRMQSMPPRSGTRSFSPSGNTDQPVYLANPSLIPPPLGPAIGVGGAKNLE